MDTFSKLLQFSLFYLYSHPLFQTGLSSLPEDRRIRMTKLKLKTSIRLPRLMMTKEMRSDFGILKMPNIPSPTRVPLYFLWKLDNKTINPIPCHGLPLLPCAATALAETKPAYFSHHYPPPQPIYLSSTLRSWPAVCPSSIRRTTWRRPPNLVRPSWLLRCCPSHRPAGGTCRGGPVREGLRGRRSPSRIWSGRDRRLSLLTPPGAPTP